MSRKNNTHKPYQSLKNLIIAIMSSLATCSVFAAPLQYSPLTNLSGANTEPVFSKKLPPDFQLPVKNGKFLSWGCSGSDIHAHCIATGYSEKKDSANKNYIPLVVSSIDGGITWIEHFIAELPPCIHWGPISCTLDVSLCIATGYDDFAGQPLVIAQSTDNMQTWDTKHFACFYGKDCKFQTSSCSGEKDYTLCIAAAGASEFADPPVSVQTKDHGQTWTDFSENLGTPIGLPYASTCMTQENAVHCSVNYRWRDADWSLYYSTLTTLDTGNTWKLTNGQTY